RRSSPAPCLLRRVPLRARAPDGEPDGPSRPQGARPAARDLGRRRRAAGAGRALPRRDRADYRPRQGTARGRPDRGPRERPEDRADARAAPGRLAKPARPSARMRLQRRGESMRKAIIGLVISVLALVGVLAASAATSATGTKFEVALKGSNEAPAAPASNKGKVELTLNAKTGKVCWQFKLAHVDGA